MAVSCPPVVHLQSAWPQCLGELPVCTGLLLEPLEPSLPREAMMCGCRGVGAELVQHLHLLQALSSESVNMQCSVTL